MVFSLSSALYPSLSFLVSRSDIHGLYQQASLPLWNPTESIQWEERAAHWRLRRDRDRGIYTLGSLPAEFRFGSVYVIIFQRSYFFFGVPLL